MTQQILQSLDTRVRPDRADSRKTAPRRIVVAMSGGVDSSVAAAVLKRQGHDVIGVTLQLYDDGAAKGRKGSCCAGQDIHDARRVADTLAIPHYVLDYEARFQSRVIEAFADSYAAGQTPIPCVTCNQEIKFRDFLDTAQAMGADTLATGHYVERRMGLTGPELYRGADPDRDQSYFLFATDRRQLERLEFPIGGSTKAEVRRLAAEFALPVAHKPDSQDICFVQSGRYSDIVERLRPDAAKEGLIKHVDGRDLGRHTGIFNFTVGQRRGLGIAEGEPLFVVRVDKARNEVVVGPRASLVTREIALEKINWLGDEPWARAASQPVEAHVRIRSTQTPVPATIQAEGATGARVLLTGTEYGVAAGQACVFYADADPRSRILGGGWIAEARAGGLEPRLTNASLETR